MYVLGAACYQQTQIEIQIHQKPNIDFQWYASMTKTAIFGKKDGLNFFACCDRFACQSIVPRHVRFNNLETSTQPNI